MAIAQLEFLLECSDVPFVKNSDGSLTLRHKEVILSEDQGGYVEARANFGPCKKPSAHRIDVLASVVNQCLGEEIHIGFDKINRCFFATAYFRPEQADYALGEFIARCDILLPLFRFVRDHGGTWDDNVLVLAFCPEEDLGHA